VRTSGKQVEHANIELSYRQRIWTLLIFVVIGFLGLLTLDPISQDPNYHLFADDRSFFSVPHFYNVVSNIGFVALGSLGALTVAGWRRRDIFLMKTDATPYAVYFISVALVGLGSTYYHWAPSIDRLLWDRLPMSIAFMAFVSAIVADRIDRKAGNAWLLHLLVALGLTSLVYWYWTEAMGQGDLRFYAFAQFYPIVMLPFVFWLFPKHHYTSSNFIFWIITWYGLSKILEHFDEEIFDILGNTISGHTLKHLAATVAALVVLRMLFSNTRSPACHLPI
jgi:hypothetical protein